MGFIRVDYETQERTVKDSAYWYRDVICNQKRKMDAESTQDSSWPHADRAGPRDL